MPAPQTVQIPIEDKPPEKRPETAKAQPRPDNILQELKGHSLNVRQRKIIRYLAANETIDNQQCQKICSSIKRTATRDLTSLTEKGTLERIGEKKGTYYILAPKIAASVRDNKGHF
jgi:predicted HTH transcriptional regulator